MLDEENLFETLGGYGLSFRENDDQDRRRVDFTIEDEEDNVAWIWGDSPSDVEWECDHPYQCIEFGDGTEQGECLLCGSSCDYHYEEDDEGNKVPEPSEWYPHRNVGGLIGDYLRVLEEA